jgi:metal-dependent amidase/aminoacylase/carboxypeptidase family protein
VTDSPHDAIPRYQDELTEIRRDLDANPELGLEEHRTSDVVAAKLAEWGSRCIAASAAPGWWACCAPATESRRSACAPTWARCPLRPPA